MAHDRRLTHLFCLSQVAAGLWGLEEQGWHSTVANHHRQGPATGNRVLGCAEVALRELLSPWQPLWSAPLGGEGRHGGGRTPGILCIAKPCYACLPCDSSTTVLLIYVGGEEIGGPATQNIL